MLLRIRYCKVVLRKFSEPSSSFTQWNFVAAWMKVMFVREVSLWKNSSLVMISVDATHFFRSREVNVFNELFILCLSLDGPIGFLWANGSKYVPTPFFHLIFTPSVMNMILQLMSIFLSYDLDCCLFLVLGLRLLFQTFGPSKFLIE